MNKTQARIIAEKVTNAELKQMFLNAQASIKNWKEVSRINKGMTKGTAFNILSSNHDSFEKNTSINLIAKRNMIWEFGEFLPGYQKLRLEKKETQSFTPAHQEPKFIKC